MCARKTDPVLSVDQRRTSKETLFTSMPHLHRYELQIIQLRHLQTQLMSAKTKETGLVLKHGG